MTSPTDLTSSNASSSSRMSRRKRTCRRRGTDSECDESVTAEQQHTTDPQTNRTGGAHDGGQQFEIKIAAVIALRGLQRGDNFELLTNKKGSGNFDDLVYTKRGKKPGRYFLQLKHSDNPEGKKLVKGELRPLLEQCFLSFCEIKYGDSYKDVPIDKTEFIIYTNRELGPELFNHGTQEREIDMILKTSDKGKIFNFTRDNNKKNDDQKKKMDKKKKKDDKNKKTDDEKIEFNFYTDLQNCITKSDKFKRLSVPQQDRSNIHCNFLGKLIMATGQKGQRELDDLIEDEIKNHDAIKLQPTEYKTILQHFKRPLETWWRNKKRENLTTEMLLDWLQTAKTEYSNPLVKSLFKSCTKKLARTGIKFTNRKIKWLETEISNKDAIHLRSDAVTLCSILLLDCLPQSKCIFVNFESLQCNEKKLLHAWLGGHWECLIVSCDATVQPNDITDTCLKMSEVIKPVPSSKRLIILTEYSVQQITSFDPIEHEFKFKQLSRESQEIVLDKKIDFQGCEVTMRSVLKRPRKVKHILGPELVTDLITEETPVNIGGKLHVNTGYYAPRVLERKVWLHSDVLRNKNDVFAVSGAIKKEVLKIVSLDETVEYHSLEEIDVTDFILDTNNRIFLLPDEDVETAFMTICENIEGKPLHWVEFTNGGLLWKMSREGTDSLLDYVDAEKSRADKLIITEYMKNCNGEVNEESIWDLGERRVLVVAEPGMGKSSTTTQVAWHTKERDPTWWVVRINWNDHTRKLKKMNAATFNLDTLVEFLCSAAFPDSKYTDSNSSLLKQALKSCGNISVLMDGFDEISPTYAEKAAVILTELMKTKVGRLWVTSRPVEKETLEEELCVTAYGMKKLSLASQEHMLINIWKYKTGEDELTDSKLLGLINYLLSNLNDVLHDDNFTGCPLYITMIATVYKKKVKTCFSSNVWIPPRIDLVTLYNKFVKRKLRIYLTEKQKADITNPSVLDEHEISKQSLLMNFEKCALVAILPPRSLHNKKIEDEIKSFLKRVDKGNDKTGIVMNVVEGKPQFVHRTFAEYFTACWFSKNFESNRSVLQHILLDRRYSFMRDMFDRMLAKDCPLHCAMLEGNFTHFSALLKEGFDVNAVDKGGRTVMHIIATNDSMLWNSRNLLHHNKFSLDKKDSVLQWTPLQYAINAADWSFVELLLESNVDRSGLDMITHQQAHDPNYIGPIIIEAAEAGHKLLLEFIHSIGVNIHQASSLEFNCPLHAAVDTEQLPVIKWLIKHGADCNTSYNDGRTPLYHAVARCSLDVVRALVEEGSVSLDVRDDRDRTAIDWAKYCASDRNRCDISTWEDQAENWKEIVKYLEERKCKGSSSVRQNNDS